MKVEFWVIGKHNEVFIEQGVLTYIKKIKNFNNIELLVFADVKNIQDANVLKLKEAEKFLDKLKIDDFVVLLDENGKQYKSRTFAKFIEEKQNQSIKKMIFIVGGAFGFDKKMYERANATIALSEMTFSHQLIRLIFLEQLYRAYSIIHHFPYHND